LNLPLPLPLQSEILSRLERAGRWFVLTGAGISAESGVPTFRGSGGLWEGRRAEELATPEGFRADPERVWRWYRWRRSIVSEVEPNAGHRAIAALERAVPSFRLATQNVDGLHARAGSRKMLELHGNIHRSRCWDGCGRSDPEPPLAGVPMCGCGGMLRPDVVWFGEPLPEPVLQEAFEEASRCEVCLVVGTSAVVYPAAALPELAHRAGAIVIEVNPDETPLSAACQLVLRGPAGEVLPNLLRALGIEPEPVPPPGV
jgi:NAD-dependent deacetylase